MPVVDTVATGLVAAFRAAAGYGTLGDGTTDVPVFDGPVPTSAAVAAYVAVGWDGADNSDEAPATWESDWAGMGAGGSRDETGQVTCVAVAGSGGSDYAALRTQVTTMLDDLRAAVAADPAVGAGPAVLWTSFATSGSMRWGSGPRGAYAAAVFTVGYQARLTD